MSENGNSLELINNLNKVIATRGIYKTIEILKKGQLPDANLQELLISIVKDSVLLNFEITEKELFFGKSRKHNRKWALSFFCYFLHKNVNFSQIGVSKIVSKTSACVSKYIKDVTELSSNIKYERLLLEKRGNMEIIIKEKIIHALRYGEDK